MIFSVYIDFKKINTLLSANDPITPDKRILELKENVLKASFRKKVKMSCTCGRSPIGKCVGWHKLSEAEYEKKKAAWDAKNAKNSGQTQ